MGETTTLPSGRATLDVPVEEWAVFMDEFTRDNRGAHGEIEILGAEDIPRIIEIEDRLFGGISVDHKDGEDTIWILFGADPDDSVSHSIVNATAVHAVPASGAQGAVLEIEAKDGTRTLLELTLPEEFALPPAAPSSS